MDAKTDLEFLKQKIAAITDHDYGDFMRKTNLYLNRFTESIQTNKPEVQKILKELKTEVQYSSNRRVDDTYDDVMRKLKRIGELL
jgi:hypothetical protein